MIHVRLPTPGVVGDDEGVEALAAARRAATDRDWADVRRLLAKADGGVETWELDAEAAWWLGGIDECITIRERVFTAIEEAGDRVGAARMAMLLSDNHLFAGRRAVAAGWLQRARRLLDAQPACLQHGCLALREGERLHGEGDLNGAGERFDEAIARGRAFADADLEHDGLQAKGRLLISLQRPAEGLAHLDEAMLAAAHGRLGPYMTGKVFCSLMSACEELGDMARIVEWSEEASRWAADHGVAVFPGLCRVHRAEVLCHRGDWHGAELEAARACAELSEVHRPNAAAAYHALGEIRRRLGDTAGADTAFARCEELGGDAQPGLALLRLTQHRVAVAAAGIDRALHARAWNPLARAKLLPAQVQVLLEAGEHAAAAAAANELDATAQIYGTAGLRGDAAAAQGRVHLAAGAHDEARTSLQDAVSHYRAADSPYDQATTYVLLARARRALGDDDGADAELTLAAAHFDTLGAHAQRLDALAHKRDTRPRQASSDGGLTERECDVLRLVVAGRTNREIASDLRLSEKTIARHLSNIFTKAGVTSRAAAAAYAFQTGIVTATPNTATPDR